MGKNKTDSTSSLKHKLHADHQEEPTNNASQSKIASDMAFLDHPSYIELQTKLTAAEEKANQNWERVLRIQADMDNAQRRVARDMENAHKYALEKFVNELLPIIDSLERAAQLPEDQQHSVLEGVKLTLQMLHTAFEKFGIQQVDPLLQPFNPELHQAISTEIKPDMQPGTVVSVLQKGYLLNNRLIRPALVVVSKAS